MPTASSKPPALTARAAYWDVDGTLARTTIVTPLNFFKRQILSPPRNALWLLNLALRGPWWLLLDRIDRSASNRAIYASYAGMPCEKIKALAAECFEKCIRPRIFPQAIEQLDRQRAEGVKIVLVTGGLDVVMRPLAGFLGAELYAPVLAEASGAYSGALTGPPIAGEEKAVAVREHSRKHGIDLAQSLAFGDAMGDLAMLECVGHPVTVNPSRRLSRLAASRGWPCENWGTRD